MQLFINNFDIPNLKKIIKKKKVKQVSSLYVSTALNVLVGLGVSVVNTSLLGPQQFGDLRFLQSLFSFVVTFLTFGVFITGSTLLARKRNEIRSHELSGSLLIFASLISIILILGLFIFSYFEESIFHNNLGRIIRIFSPLLFVYPFQLCLDRILTGNNRIYELSVFHFLPSALYLIGAITFNYFIPLSLILSLAIFLSVLAAVIVINMFVLKPKFKNIKKNLSIIWKENKTYGYHVYIGVLTAVGSGHLAGLLIAYYVDNTNVGFYSLALTVTMPLTLLPNAVSTTYFKDFANIDSIPRKVTIITGILSICSLLFFILVIDKVIIFAYSAEYSAVVPIAYLVSIGSVVHGFGDFFNRFLGANGQGKAMRNGSIIVGISNLVGYFILIPYLGVMGAAIAKVITSFVYLIVRYYPYQRIVKKKLTFCERRK